MKLKEYLKDLQTVVKNHPESLEYDVVYSKDDEGNEFNLVNYSPTIGHFDADDRDFDDNPENFNSICVN